MSSQKLVEYLYQPDWEDPLKKEMTTHSSILAWRVPWTEEPTRLQAMEWQESDMTERLNHDCYVLGTGLAVPKLGIPH